MPAQSIQLSDADGPFEVSLSVGGAFPYRWKLFDYSGSDATGWRTDLIAEGKGPQWTDLPFKKAADANGHYLVWTVGVVDADPGKYDAEIKVIVDKKGGEVQGSVKSIWSVDPDWPWAYVTVALKI